MFLIVDDMNDYGFLGAYPGKVVMPAIEAFQSQAVTFDHAYCAAPACVPSRACVFSGLQPYATGAYRNGCDPWRQSPLDQTESLPELFRRSGYETFGRGKLTHAPVAEGRLEKMWSNETWGGGFGPFPPEEDQLLGKFWGHTAWEGPDSDFPDVINADAAIEFLQGDHEQPFFLALGLWRPHTPFTAPKRFFDLYDLDEIEPPPYQADDLDDVPQSGRALAEVWGERFDLSGRETPDRWREFVRAYLACTSFADWNVGRVLEALAARPDADDTLVVFWSDNGYHCGEKDHWEKNTLWEQSALVPLAVRPPRAPHRGAMCSRAVSLNDLYPTLVDYCGLETPTHHLEGRSLRTLLDDPVASWERTALTCYGEDAVSVRDERYRYIRYPDGSEELYDHSDDPHEWTNLAGETAFDAVKERLAASIPQDFAPSLGGRLG